MDTPSPAKSIKHNKFLRDHSMGEKLITELPGVGDFLLTQCKALGFTKAKDLYKLLQNLNFDREAFRVQLNVPESKNFQKCFTALMDWHLKYDRTNSPNNSETENPKQGPKKVDFAEPTTPIKLDNKKINIPTSTDVTGPETNIVNITLKFDSVLSYFLAISETVKTFPPEQYLEVKTKVDEVIRDIERRNQVLDETEPVASTSS